MFDHVGISVLDVEASKQFYLSILTPLGLKVLHEYPTFAVGFGDVAPQFWLGLAREGAVTTKAHFAFKASSKELVHQVYDIAIAAGAKDNGAPGFRAQYNYYAAFFLDKDGNNIEVVFRE